MADGAQRGHIVVFGFRGVARRIVHQLTSAGQDVVVVESDPTPAELATMSRYGASYVESYRQTQQTLDDAAIDEARAVVCAFNDDVRNIEVALLVRKRAPGTRVVVQMANPAVGRALQGVATPGAVLQVAELAAPSFVETTISRTTHEVDFGGREFVVSTLTSWTRCGRSFCRTVWPVSVATLVLPPTWMLYGPSRKRLSCPSSI